MVSEVIDHMWLSKIRPQSAGYVIVHLMDVNSQPLNYHIILIQGFLLLCFFLL